jgi:hypothetical protein
MTTFFSQKNPTNFHCICCDYNTSYSKDYNKHINTKKHKNNENNANDNKNVLNKNKTYLCNNCNKYFNDRAGLWRHSKKCIVPIDTTNDNTYQKSLNKDEIIIMLIKENKDFKSMMIEQQNIMLKVLENGTNNNSHNTIHTNSHNKAFNLNFFLNETCKNAMNITEFVDSIKLQLSDFMEVGKAGYVQGISNIIVKKLNDLDETIRPIHCTDQKRETFYVKDENKWEKEEEDMKKIRKMINKVAFKNEWLMSSYKERYPDYNDPTSNNSDKYSKYVIEALGGEGENNKEKENKIIKHISKATLIKNKYFNKFL